jgi:hypothetical protein
MLSLHNATFDGVEKRPGRLASPHVLCSASVPPTLDAACCWKEFGRHVVELLVSAGWRMILSWWWGGHVSHVPDSAFRF